MNTSLRKTLVHVARIERERFLVHKPFFSYSDKERRATCIASVTKHLFLIVGEPRVGKTTLASFAAVSPSVLHVDTDVFTEDRLQEQTKNAIDNFYRAADQVVCVLTVGKHRRWLSKVREYIQAFAKGKQMLVSVCQVSRYE